MTRELAALALLIKVCSGFQQRHSGLTLDRLAEDLRLPLRFARGVVDDLMSLELVVRVQDGVAEGRLQPAVAPDDLTVVEVLRLIRDRGADGSLPVASPTWVCSRELEHRLRAAEEQALDGMTMRDLVLQVEQARES